VDTQSSQIAGNVDRRQMQELPLQGRNWLELAMLIKGITANNVTNAPGVNFQNQYQLNIDGQQVTQRLGETGFGQPRFSREAIAEFQIVTQLFDVTQGRSTGVQVQAITRTGTNQFNGSTFGYFRDDQFNDADPVAGRVLPYSNQQVGGSVGGPIIRDKLHFFGSYEYEREPFTVFSQPTFLPGQTFTFDAKNTQKIYFGRMDYQRSTQDHFSVRATGHRFANPFSSVTGTTHPSQAILANINSNNVLGTWSRVHSDNRVSEIRVGYNGFYFLNDNLPALVGTVQYEFPGLTIGQRYNQKNEFWQDTLQFRYDLTWIRGKHDLRIGGEFLRVHDTGEWHLNEFGRMFFHTRPPDLTRRFPQDAWNDPSRWDLTGLDPFVQRFEQAFHTEGWFVDVPRPTFAVWFGDTWRVTDRFTLNYGLRWDDDPGATAPPGITETDIPIDNRFESLNAGFRSGIRDHMNLAPRAGFAYNVGGTSTFVIRGGSGLYYTVPTSNITYSHQLYNQMVSAEFTYDGRTGFVLDPRRGTAADDILNGRVPLPPQAIRVLDPEYRMPVTWQSALGVQKQLGPSMGFDVDLVHWIAYRDPRTYDPNLFYDPATGYNINPRNGRPNPAYGQITWFESTGKRDRLALASSLSRRLQSNVQAGLTYTLLFYQHDDGQIGFTGGPADNNFNHLDGEWARSTEFQRHTLRAHAIVQLPWQFSVSAVYFYGSGNYYSTTHATTPFGIPGQNRLNLGPAVTIPEAMRDRFDGPTVINTGDLVPRNALQGLPLHKVDFRLTKQVNLGGGANVSLMAEVFNLFNHDNFGSYVGTVNTATFGEPRASTGNAYVPRSGQLAFRVAF
jgi:hypothetical protein